jgi:hypothetical protein
MAVEDPRTTNVIREETPVVERPVADRVSGPVFARRLVYYIGGALLILLALRFVLALLGANRANPFADFIFSLSTPFVAPFFGLFAYEPVYGQFAFELGTLVAIAVYGAVTAGLARLFTLNRRDVA